MNMIERVVNALDKCDAEYDGPTRGIYEAFAKAAITAMREPSEEMLDGCKADGEVSKLWKKMIDAALTGEKK